MIDIEGIWVDMLVPKVSVNGCKQTKRLKLMEIGSMVVCLCTYILFFESTSRFVE